MKLNKLQCKALEKRFGKVVFKHFPNDPDAFKWEQAGRPRIFIPVEQEDGYTVVIDYGYSYMVLFKGNKICGTGKNEIIPYGESIHNIIVLDKEYYNINKYIWK